MNVTDFETAKRFYLGALEPLGYRVVYEEPGVLAYLADAHGLDFGIGRRGPVGGAHVAFDCDDRETVDAFYDAALAAGGRRQRRARASGRSTTRTTTPRTFSTPTATTSRPSATTHRPRLRACPGNR